MNFLKFILSLVCVLSPALSSASDLAEKLNSSHHVLLMRHALAPGTGDPAHYTLADCKTQRNLSDEGRQHAVQVGKWLKKQGITTADVYSSTWCRCKDTADLLNFGGYQVEPALASFFDDMHQAKERNRQLQAFIASKLATKGKKALILVTHHVNIYEFMGENIGSGDLVLAKVDAQGKMLSYRRIARPE